MLHIKICEDTQNVEEVKQMLKEVKNKDEINLFGKYKLHKNKVAELKEKLVGAKCI